MITIIHSFFQKVAVRRTKGFNQFRWSEITFSDVYQLNNLLKINKFNWKYIIKTAKEFGWTEVLVYYLSVLHFSFPDFNLETILKKIDPQNNRIKYTLEVKEQRSFPIYTKIPTTYILCFQKLKKEFENSIGSGAVYFYHMHKWFVSNFIRIIFHKVHKELKYGCRNVRKWFWRIKNIF